MNEIYEVGESTRNCVPKHLEQLVRYVQEELESDVKENEFLIVLLYTLMSEMGFTSSHIPDTTPSYGNGFNRRKLLATTKMPANWRNDAGTTYSLLFHLLPSREFTCQFISDSNVPGILLINIVSTLSDTTMQHCDCLHHADYINPGTKSATAIYRNLPETSKWFKDLILPMRNAMLEERGLLNSSLSGLPFEMKYKICEYLSVIDGWKPLAETCSDFRELTMDQKLWEMYVKRDYGRALPAAAAATSQPIVDWKEEYKKSHISAVQSERDLQKMLEPKQFYWQKHDEPQQIGGKYHLYRKFRFCP